MNKVVVIIPIYKKEMSLDEQASLKQCLKILGKHKVTFMCPESLDIVNFEIFVKQSKIDFIFKRFEDKHFKSIGSYSKFLLASEFYRTYINYDFMFIYQLDAWVFEDKLEYWCDQGYDYIGAPLLKQKSDTLFEKIAGNGGFSLRKIKSILSVIDNKVTLKEIFLKYKNKNMLFNSLLYLVSIFRYFLQFIKKYYCKKTKHNEDFVFSRYGRILNPLFKIAPFEVSSKFAFERFPKRLYEMNNNRLPFGCHAFRAYEFDTFWKEYIKI